MKSQTSFFKAALLALAFSLTGFFASSQTTSAVNKPAMSVNYLGAVGDKILFELTLVQPDETRSSLRIRDGNGAVLYSELIYRQKITKKFQVPRDELQKVEFVFTNGKDEVRKSYEIKLEYKEVLEVTDVSAL